MSKGSLLAHYEQAARANTIVGKGLHNPRLAHKQTRAVKGTHSPKRKPKVTPTHTGVTLPQWLAIAVFFLALYAGVSWWTRPQSPVTSKTIEIYRYYTVERTNGRVTLVRVDTDKYNIACDGLEATDEGHNCVLMSQDAIDEFRTLTGY